jgi:hypothetical protein
MKDFMAKLREGFLNSFDREEFIAPSLRIIRQRKTIRESLQESRLTGKVVGIYSAVLGEGMFLVCVDDIATLNEGEIITFKPYDMNGVLLVRNTIALTEIRSVCPFESFYIDPINLRSKQYA